MPLDVRLSAQRLAYARRTLPGVDLVRPAADRFEETLALLRSSDEAVLDVSDWTADELRDEWDGLDLERDAWLIELDGRLAGVAHLLERRGGRFVGDGYVHPELRGRGVGDMILRLLENRALELRSDWPAGERVVLEAAHLVGDDSAPALFSGRGYVRVRSFFRMVIDVTGLQSSPVWPKGIELRPFDVNRNGPAVHAANEEAFVDEWGHVGRPYDIWKKRTLAVRRFDPSLVPVAWDGDELAGVALNYPKRNGDWGWVGTLAVRPSWRRRGLGLALLHESFRRFRATGETTVALGVDVENPTGATRLYERAGMRVFWQADVWQKELRPAEPST